MKHEIEYGDWVYFESSINNIKAYKVLRPNYQDMKAEICANDGERLYVSLSKLKLITDTIKIQELESSS